MDANMTDISVVPAAHGQEEVIHPLVPRRRDLRYKVFDFSQ
jgi:hypothetical protein